MGDCNISESIQTMRKREKKKKDRERESERERQREKEREREKQKRYQTEKFVNRSQEDNGYIYWLCEDFNHVEIGRYMHILNWLS